MMKFGKEWKKKDKIMKIRICASTNSSLRKYELEQEDCEEEDEI